MQYTVFFHELFSASVLPSSISGWLYFFRSIEVLTYEQNLLLLFLNCHTLLQLILIMWILIQYVAFWA